MSEILLTYRIDRNETIIAVEGDYREFAEMHGGTLFGFGVQAKTGRPWPEVVVGDSMRLYHQIIITSVRALGQPITRAYRGDARGLHHHLELRAVPEADGVVRIEHHYLKSVPGALEVKLIGDTSFGKLTLSRCAVCSRMNSGDGWHPAASLARRNGWKPGEVQRVGYGVCWECSDSLGRDLCARFEPAEMGGHPSAPEVAPAQLFAPFFAPVPA